MEPGGTHLYDGLGSVVGLTNTSGALVNTYRYDPYGNVVTQTGSVPNRWGFAGGYRDATGFLKFGQRYYDPTTGRWTQTDPVAASPSRPAIASPFTYAGSDPVNNVDPSGLVLATGGSGGHWLPRWRPTWTARWSPGWHATWTPQRAQIVRPTSTAQGTVQTGTTGSWWGRAWDRVQQVAGSWMTQISGTGTTVLQTSLAYRDYVSAAGPTYAWQIVRALIEAACLYESGVPC